jgi:ribosomal protein L7/L12
MSSATWEYRVLEIAAGPAEVEHLLNERGGEGWELVAVVPPARVPKLLTVFLKRLSATDLTAERTGNGGAATAESDQAVGAEKTEEAEPETGFSVVLTAIHGEQAEVVLAIAHLCPWLHLKDAKRIVESPPAAIAVGLGEDEAAVLRLALIDVGATVEVRGASAI